MDCTVNQRLKEFIEKKNISQRDIQLSLGLKNEQSISNWMGFGEQIPDKHLPTIIRKYPSLNANWFLKGTGEMEENVLRIIEDSAKKYENGIEVLKDELIKNQKERIGELKEQLDFYKNIIETQYLDHPRQKTGSGSP